MPATVTAPPLRQPSTVHDPLPPLADHFFIAGIETSAIIDQNVNGNAIPTSPMLDSTIEEVVEANGHTRQASQDTTQTAAKRRSGARFSFEPRHSIGSVIALEPKITGSNRSSATIRAVPTEDLENGNAKELDFDKALESFVAGRDLFLEDIQFSAGQLHKPDKPRPRPKTQRITSEDARKPANGVDGLRRRLSTMNPLSRPSTSSRRTSVRTSKRMSGYNSVIPSPQRFQAHRNMHPLKRPYEPVLLDQYPPKELKDIEFKQRSPFPDYIPMFVFPNDINVVAADERPRTTWHGFAMTNSDGSKLYGMCILIWMPLQHNAAQELERQCEVWRNKNMTPEEREMARDLGDRLVTQRQKLSELLIELPAVPSGTAERDALEEEISAVEEKIALMTDALRPVRHGAASKIDGLTDGDTGFWIPRAYGVLGRDHHLTSFWKEWLRAIAVPMLNGQISQVPPSSPRVGMWQPVERYVVNLCAEAPSPMTSITQVELAVRDLRLYARREAINEEPGCRNTDLYALFRCLDVADVVVLFEYVLAESRIILLSSHTAMLHLACSALTQLIHPLKWAGVYIPVLPARLIQALEAPCPYIVGIERRYENVELPEDDFVLVDLDNGVIESTAPPVSLPRQQRRKLLSILQLAAPHRYRYGVPLGPPKYAQEAFPNDAFSAENASIFRPTPSQSNLAHLANLPSAAFGHSALPSSRARPPPPPLLNVFGTLQASRENSSGHGSSHDRPTTSSTGRSGSTYSPAESPVRTTFPTLPPPPPPPVSRSDSGYALQTSLREKRSGIFDGSTLRRNSSFGISSALPTRSTTTIAPTLQGHSSQMSVSTFGGSTISDGTGGGFAASTYAPSIYAQSTLAASTIMPQVLVKPVKAGEALMWCEGHCMRWRGPASGQIHSQGQGHAVAQEEHAWCSVCEERAGSEGVYRCTACAVTAHPRCTVALSLPCVVAFHPEQILAAFLRCFASLFYTYRKSLTPTAANSDARKSGMLYKFSPEALLKSVPSDTGEYLKALLETQAFNEFMSERERLPSGDPQVRLFDEVILSKRNRGRAGFLTGKRGGTGFLSDAGDWLWRTASVASAGVVGPSLTARSGLGGGEAVGRGETGSGYAGGGSGNGMQYSVMGRTPAKLQHDLMREPRVVQGAPVTRKEKMVRRKQVPGMRDSTATVVGMSPLRTNLAEEEG